MALILSIETSTTVCSAALHRDGKLLSVLEVHQEYSHASKLGLLVQEAIRLADVQEREIEAVAVAAGPGSYTGLRIGVSLAKGFCYALDIPLISVATLEILAARVSKISSPEALLCPMIDARRMEVYCAVFDKNLEVVEGVKAQIVEENTFQEYLQDKPVIFFGNGAMKCNGVITHPHAKFVAGINPSATELGELAFTKFASGHHEDLDDFVPLYLKEFLIKKPVKI
jgi:tRNA threonylcarbamoyladenosine biosynthesis protein TsaB